jgi:hypothetical protein
MYWRYCCFASPLVVASMGRVAVMTTAAEIMATARMVTGGGEPGGQQSYRLAYIEAFDMSRITADARMASIS